LLTVIIQAHASWLSETKLYENVTYVPHAARGYRAKVQRQEYTERHMPDSNDNIYMKNRISTH